MKLMGSFPLLEFLGPLFRMNKSRCHRGGPLHFTCGSQILAVCVGCPVVCSILSKCDIFLFCFSIVVFVCFVVYSVSSCVIFCSFKNAIFDFCTDRNHARLLVSVVCKSSGIVCLLKSCWCSCGIKCISWL